MQTFFNFEILSFISLFMMIFIISYFMFSHKRYKKIDNRLKITIYQELFLTILLFSLSILSLFVPFMAYINNNYIGIFTLGLIIGALFVKVYCRYYVHDGLIILGTLIAIGVTFLIQNSSFENICAALTLGISGSLILLPLYGRVLTTYSKNTTVIMISILIVVLFISVLIQEVLLPSTVEWLYYGVFVILGISGIVYLFFGYRYILTWFIWLMFELIISFRYKLIYEGTEHLSEENALLLLSNHSSWLDWVILQFPLKRRIHYMINKKIYFKWFLNPFIRLNECIPISKHASNEGFSKARKFLKNRHVIGMFPEGSISRTGELGRFYPGFELIAGSADAKIVPVHINGLWGSIFSRSKKKFCNEKNGFRRVIRIRFGPLLALNTKAIEVKQAVKKLQDEHLLKKTS